MVYYFTLCALKNADKNVLVARTPKNVAGNAVKITDNKNRSVFYTAVFTLYLFLCGVYTFTKDEKSVIQILGYKVY